MSMVKIRVPATTANIGPGFDVLGLALSLYNTYEFTENPIAENFDSNMVFRAYKYTFQSLGRPIVNVDIKIEADIPIARGLGSSAACIVAGIMGANFMMGNLLDKQDILNLATQLEGHPDNVAPAIFGGLMISVMDEDGIVTNRIKPDEELRFVAMIPNVKLSTAEARKVLPKEIPFKDAIYNIGRVSLLVSALASGNEELLEEGLKDCLHQPYRGELIPDYEKISAITMDEGALGSFISGAGPTIMSIVKIGSKEFVEAMKGRLSGFSNSWNIIELQTEVKGAEIID